MGGIKGMTRRKIGERLALFVFAGVGATACIGERPIDDEPFVPFMAISHEASEAAEVLDYVEGEETGFTVRVSAADAQTHGLPRELVFVAGGGQNASTSAIMSAYEEGGKPIPDQFDCFGPIEILDQSGQVTVTIDNFCPEGNIARLSLVGDISAGGDPRWRFDSPDGQVLHNFDQ